MPIIADLPPRQRIIAECSVAECLVSDAQGNEGQRLYEEASRACRHWEERAEQILSREECVEEDWDYMSVPPRHVGEVQVQYKFVGKHRPLPYEWDE